jgi:hypothetical protein
MLSDHILYFRQRLGVWELTDKFTEAETMEKTTVKKKEIPGRSLIDLVFSWSIKDVLNENHFKSQVCQPFNSLTLLIARTHGDYDMNHLLIGN